MFLRQCVFLFLTLLATGGQTARILGVFTIASISHQLVFQSIWRELSLKGHQVTVLTPNPLKDPSLTNLTEIDLGFLYEEMEEFKQIASVGLDHWAILNQMEPVFVAILERLYQSDEVRNFVSNNETSYDVVLAESIDQSTYAFAAKFGCPLIGIASLDVFSFTHEAIGNPAHPVLHPDILTPYIGGELSFFEKMDSILFSFYEKYVFDYKFIPIMNDILRQYIGNDLPDIRDIERNMSMLFLNTNPIIHGVRSYGPNVIEYGGAIHLKPQKPLPLELKSFLDNATEGVIYFSLGSNVKSIYLPEDKRNILMNTFAKLPYKVLWKFEDDKLKGKPENVKISKWLPQQDLLRHPNIKLFITQAGLQSLEEALVNGIPILALPFMADQHLNAARIQKLGIGLRLDFNTLSEETISSSIKEIIQSQKFKRKAVEVGKLLKDQPMSGLEKVVWWTEYVIRHQGAPYLRNPRADISWFDFLILDVVAFLLGTIIITIFTIHRVTKLILTLLKSSSLQKSKVQ